MKKKVTAEVKLEIAAGKATPAPPVGSILGPRGINLGDFCKQFNDQSVKEVEAGTPLPTIIRIYADRTFTFEIKNPPTSFFLKKRAGIEKGSSLSGRKNIGKISKSDVYEIAKIKIADMQANSLEAAVSTVEGTARSMGLQIVNE